LSPRSGASGDYQQSGRKKIAKNKNRISSQTGGGSSNWMGGKMANREIAWKRTKIQVREVTEFCELL